MTSAIIAIATISAVVALLWWLMKDLSVETLSTISVVSGICGMLSSCN